MRYGSISVSSQLRGTSNWRMVLAICGNGSKIKRGENQLIKQPNSGDAVYPFIGMKLHLWQPMSIGEYFSMTPILR